LGINAVRLILGLLRGVNGGGDIKCPFCKLFKDKINKMSSSGAGPGEWTGISSRHERETSLAPKRVKKR
jgi:hypothetical protein